MIGILARVRNLRLSTQRTRGGNHRPVVASPRLRKFITGSALVLVPTVLAADVFVSPHQRWGHRTRWNNKGFRDERLEQKRQDKSNRKTLYGLAHYLNACRWSTGSFGWGGGRSCH
jgi:hypothetical protein